MIAFPHAKINLGLRILDRRADGYHNLSSFFVPVTLHDALEFIPGKKGFRLHMSGDIPDGKEDDNLVLQAAALIQKVSTLLGGDVYLHKAIPSGAGLGGGSSDAAHILILINKSMNLGFTDEQLLSFADELGSDCPFFIHGGIRLAGGRGEVLREAVHKDRKLKVVILKPSIQVSTAEAYRNVKAHSRSTREYAQDTLLADIHKWPDLLRNDFQPWAVERYPEIGSLITQLQEHGAFYASLSGSGSSVYGFFQEDPGKIEAGRDVFRWEGEIRI